LEFSQIVGFNHNYGAGGGRGRRSVGGGRGTQPPNVPAATDCGPLASAIVKVKDSRVPRTDDDDAAECGDEDEDEDQDDEWQPPQTTTRARTDTKFRLHPGLAKRQSPVATRATSLGCIALHSALEEIKQKG